MNESLVVIVRGIIAFFSLLFFTRILGKQQISQLTFFDYIVGITIGSIAATLTTDLTSRALPHWIGLVVWTVLSLSMQLITIKWRRAGKFIGGEPTVAIMNGKIMESTIKKMRFRGADLMEQLREKGVFSPQEVEFAILETDGRLSVLKKAENQPVTPKDLNMPVGKKGVNTELIYDGVVYHQNLKQVNRDRKWLDTQLQMHGIKDESEVFLAVFDPESGQFYIDRYEDKVKNLTDMSDYPEHE
ncbi:DUF421 domain-containing protein [Scopulibacillus darangshiensis]|uniref:DUF421 domain-containing protein n=1 Tax=Scopulibacillus darangshiensis TaxID=442528 RepID=UPI00104904DB|nr:DUF421 domain-containing protein [Scopulibacillus darangshiensis]